MEDLNGRTAETIKRKAINLVPVTVGMNFLAWLLAGFLFGFLQPALLQHFFGMSDMSITDGLRMFMGITFVGGSLTTVFVFFSCERIWRTEIARFFPGGELSHIHGTFKLSVEKRLLIVFLMISLVPLTLIGVGSYIKASALLSADPTVERPIVWGLMRMIVFFVIIGVGMSIGLSALVAGSVSNPLQDMASAMKKIGQGNLDVAIPVVSTDEIGTLGEGFNQMIQGLKESELIKESFGKYVSREIRDEILKGNIPLDGEMKRVTLLFSDLRNFTPFVESTHPKHVVAIMNQYFSEMTEAIKENRGLVLQYVGDEIEAVFGAPVNYEGHPDMAVQAALEMRRRLTLLNQSLEKEGFKPLRHGIGIHTGAVLAGNIGSRERVSYALVGDTVNSASRISELTKKFLCDIIVSRTTRDLLAGSFPVESLPAVKVKGKKDELTVYRLGT
jgi:adenylate cyclase